MWDLGEMRGLILAYILPLTAESYFSYEPMRRSLAFVVLVLALGAPTIRAQNSSWPTTHQQALWLTLNEEHRVSEHTSL